MARTWGRVGFADQSDWVRPLPAGAAATAAAGPAFSDQVNFLTGITADGALTTQSYWNWAGTTAFKFGAPTAGVGATVHYALDAASAFDAQESATFEKGLAMWAAVANVTFVRADAQAAADLVLKRGTDGEAYATMPVAPGSGQMLGTFQGQAVISIDTSVAGFDLSGSLDLVAGYGFATLVHEIGHALGLGHAGAYNETVDPMTQQYGSYDNRMYTVMSYLSWQDWLRYTPEASGSTHWGWSADGYARVTPHGVMQADVAAIQRLYGAPTVTEFAGGDRFGYNTTVRGPLQSLYDFNLNTAPVVTLFSTGTGNTLDLSGSSTNAFIDLGEGKFSSVAGLTNNLSIAIGTLIADAVGSRTYDSITGNAAANRLWGLDGADTLWGLAGNDVLTGGTGSDTLFGGVGDDLYLVDDTADRVEERYNEGTDTIHVSANTYTLISSANIEQLLFTGIGDATLTGGATNTLIRGGTGNDRLTGYNGNDRLEGGAGNDWLGGGVGADVLVGGLGDDTYLFETADQLIESSDGGVDTIVVMSTITLALAEWIENLNILEGTLDATGNALANAITGGNGNDRLEGVGGGDVLLGGAGDDRLAGGDDDDRIEGGAGLDRLEGGAGQDQLIGGAGDDDYWIDALDAVVEAADAGIDTIHIDARYVLGESLENLVFTGSGPHHGTGNTQDNLLHGSVGWDVLRGLDGVDVLIGGEGNDRLDGGAGADRMEGGLHDDTYYVDSRGDQLVEAGNGGIDSVIAFVAITLAANFENLTLASSAKSGTGNSGDNRIEGSAAAETLAGLGGADTLSGGDGNDRLEGGDGDDRLDGGAGRDTLIGGAGPDQLIGGAGDDLYQIDAKDRVVETADGGRDTIQVDAARYVLGASLEDLVFTGSGPHHGTGNAQDNLLCGAAGSDVLRGLEGADVLIGGDGDDRLDGGAGADRMEGGLHDDTYVIDARRDRAVESKNAGTDTVVASVAVTLAANVENLTLTRTAKSGTGNDGANRIEGSAGDDRIFGLDGGDTLLGDDGADRLDGGTGRDTLTGGAGADVLIGGKQADRFVFLAGDTGRASFGADLIADFTRRDGDTIDLSGLDGALHYIGANGFSGAAGELRAVFDGGETRVLADLDGDGKADLMIRLAGEVHLFAGDFVL